MDEPDPSLLELAALVRGALVLADRYGLHAVAAHLDGALLGLVALDNTGTITPQPYDLPDLNVPASLEDGFRRSA